MPALAIYRSLVQIYILSFTVRTPDVFFMAGDAGGIKKAAEMLLLSIRPRFVMLYPVGAENPKNILPINFAALLGKSPLQEIKAASRTPGSRWA